MDKTNSKRPNPFAATIAAAQSIKQESRSVFVIMPFVSTPTRDEARLTAFFNNELKSNVESCDVLKYKYAVRRSESHFDINAAIITDLYESDVVICDLSGFQANPNVMYELGVRLSLTSRPVILIREEHLENKKIFDIQGFYTFSYDPLNYGPLRNYVIRKLGDYESKADQFVSPIHKVLGMAFDPLSKNSRSKAANSVDAMSLGLGQHISTLAGAIVMACDRSGVRLEVKDSIDIVDQLFSRFAELARTVPWKSFGFTPGCHPAVSAYLAERPTRGLVTEWIEKECYEHMLSVHARYMLTDYMWKNTCTLPDIFYYANSVLGAQTRSAVIAQMLRLSESDPSYLQLQAQYKVATMMSKRLDDWYRDAVKNSFATTSKPSEEQMRPADENNTSRDG